METSVKIYQINNGLSETEKAVRANRESADLFFYQFIGGNASETDELSEQLYALKNQNTLLIGIFRFPFRFEGKKRFETATAQYFRMRELCDAVIYFNSDGLLESIDSNTTIRDAQLSFNIIEQHAMESIKEMIDITGEMNIDFQDIQTFIRGNKGPLSVHTLEETSFDEPLKYHVCVPYLPEDFTDGTQMIVNIGYTRDTDMNAFQQINLRLHDLFSKADLFKLGSYFINEPGDQFKITLLVNGIKDPVKKPENYKKLSKYNEFVRKIQNLTDLGKNKLKI